MKKIIIPFLVVLSTVSSLLYCEITHAPDLTVLELALKDVDEDTLVMFDVDETLITAEDCILRTSSRPISEKYLNNILRDPKIVPPGKYPEHYLHSKVLLQMRFQPVDARLPEIIRSLQQNNIKTIAFTKMEAGSYGILPSLADWRVAHLKQNQYDFSEAFPDIGATDIGFFLSRGYFKEGVLFSNKNEKGPVLISFLKHIKWRPKKIIFLDDRKDYHQSVEKALENSKIEYVGLHYTAAADHASKVDEKLAKFQYMHLALHGEWLSDKEAKEAMKEAIVDNE